MKKFVSSIILVTCLLATTAAVQPVQAADKANIFMVNFEELGQALVVKDLDKKFTEKKNELNKALTAESKDLEKKLEEWHKQKTILNEQANTKKFKELEKLSMEFQKKQQLTQARLNEAYGKAYQQIEKAISEILEKLASEYSYTMVVSSSAVVYSDQKTNLTPRLIKELDAKITKVEFDYKK